MKLFYRKDELPEATTLGMSTIEEEIRQGRFPKARQISPGRTGYLCREVDEWAQSRPVADMPPPPNTNAKKPRKADTAGRAVPA